MSELDDLLAEIDDPDVAEKVKAKFDEQNAVMAKRQALMERDAKVRQEQARLAQKFPRAMVAFNKGRFALPDDPSDDALVAALKAKEEELEDLGVPASVGKSSVQEPASATGEPDPASAWGEDISTGRGDTQTLDLMAQFAEKVESGDQLDRLDAISILSAINAQAQQSGDFSNLDALNQQYGPKYPVTKGPPTIITNLTPIHGAGANRAQAQPAKIGRPAKATAE